MWFQHRLRPRISPRRRRARPQLAPLDDRLVPSTLTVTNTLDSSPGSLRADITAAQSGDTIVFAKSLTGKTITLNGSIGELYIDKNLDIEGPGAKYLAISGAGSRLFEIAPHVQVTLAGMTIENGDGQFSSNGVGWGGGPLQGGGILNFGTLTVSGCTVTGNDCPTGGGGIANESGGSLTITGSTVSKNFSDTWYGISEYGGGGIYNAGTLTVSGSTVTQNTGGGIFNDTTGILTVLHGTVTSNKYGFDLYNLGAWSADSTSKIGTVGP